MKKIILLAFLFSAAPLFADAPTAVSTMTITPGRMGIFDVNVNLFAASATWTTELNLTTAAYLGRVRSNWDMINTLHPNATTWNFTYMDSIVSAMEARNLKISYYVPWRASWWAADPTCQSTNPFCGCGAATSITQCPTSDMAAYDVFVTSMAQRYCNDFDTWEVYNEPDLLSAATSTLVYLRFATHTIVNVKNVCSSARFAVPALANPRNTEWQGSLQAGVTNYVNGCFFADLVSRLPAALPVGTTLSDLYYSVHGYYEANGGNLTLPIILSTMTSILNNAGVVQPKFKLTEYGAFGGSPGESYPAYEVQKSSVAMKFTAIAFSSNPAYNAIVTDIIYHNMAGFAFSATTSTPSAYTPTPVYYVLQKLSETLDGTTSIGNQGDGTNVFIYKFVSDSKTTYIAWTQSGVYLWALNPPRSVFVTDTDGVTQEVSKDIFTPYALSTDPIIVEVPGNGTSLRGLNIKGLEFDQ